ncbi:MAG TPA: efflux RND transporter periplasmic adaptor subunit [Blastocatellia bacterium]|nr:efflux RND transporter periplasmic adaptor subunit [Blastocatellia bacterium]
MSRMKKVVPSVISNGVFNQNFKRLGVLFLIVVALCMAAGCSKAAGQAQLGPPDVEVIKVEQKDVPIYSEWIGTLDGMVNSEIKAQVAGYLLTKNYTEGGFVKKGQLLFEIDPRPLQAVRDQAKGSLAQAEAQVSQANAQLLHAQAELAQAQANQGKAQLDVDRYTPLVQQKAITTQEMDNAIQANLSAKAQVGAAQAGVEMQKSAIVAARALVEAARAAVATAELNLGFTRIASPIDGIAGIAQAQVGNLVSPSGPALTTVSTLDPIKCYFTLSEQEYLSFIDRYPTQSQRDAVARKLELELVLSDGTTYPQKGKFFVADREVNQKTGTIRLAGIFPNSSNTLRPGQYGRVRAVTSLREGALLIPQRAVSELQGSYQVGVVSADSKVEVRIVKVGERIGGMWIIEEGLKAGETVVAEGMQRVKPGAPVNPKPYAGAVSGP